MLIETDFTSVEQIEDYIENQVEAKKIRTYISERVIEYQKDWYTQQSPVTTDKRTESVGQKR